jgi:hypothetical protein
MGRVVARLVFAALAFCTALAGSARGQTTIDSDVVQVEIKVQPFAEFEVPNNGGFKIVVEPQKQCPPFPSHAPRALKALWIIFCWDYLGLREWPLIKPVRIPFSVTGNTDVTMSMAPSQFLKIKTSRWMGKATRIGGATIGYHGIVHFPVPAASYGWLLEWLEWDDFRLWINWPGFGRLPAWSLLAHLPGLNNTGTPPLIGHLPLLGNKAWGVIYIVAKRDWTASGQNATPGDYLGNVVITIAPN